MLGVDTGPSEDHQFCFSFLRSLVRRGLKGVRLLMRSSVNPRLVGLGLRARARIAKAGYAELRTLCPLNWGWSLLDDWARIGTIVGLLSPASRTTSSGRYIDASLRPGGRWTFFARADRTWSCALVGLGANETPGSGTCTMPYLTLRPRGERCGGRDE